LSRKSPESLPVLPLKNATLFPYLIAPLGAGRPASVAALDAALASEEKEILVVGQRDAAVEDPTREDLFEVGTKGVIRTLARALGGVQTLIQGTERVRLSKTVQDRPYLRVEFEAYPVERSVGEEVEALEREVRGLLASILSLTRPQAELGLADIFGHDEDTLRLVYGFASMLGIDAARSQALLEANTLAEALRLMHGYLQHERRVLQLRQDIASKAQTEMSKQQREFVLREQLRAIQQELGEGDPEKAEVQLLQERLAQTEPPELVRKEVERELNRLARLPVASPEHSVIRTYVDFVLDLPWRPATEEVLDLRRARNVLDEDHHDLQDVKDRILEHLATLKLNPKAKAPILCFVGPPGTGKTSLGQSIARALGRRFERMSLGGLHDEAELRGHRRTYIGAMPGRILQAIRRAGVGNPLLMLDEVDKLGRDFRGDPASAMLEILDPEQNSNFRDNYLDLPFDLSRVFFIVTANALETIPPPLLDRMEVLHLAGYSEEEKLAIARRYLLPRRLKEAGLDDATCRIPEPTLIQVIRRYTREAGVRQLERAIGSLARKVALRFAEGSQEPVSIAASDLSRMLGPEPFHLEAARQELPAGVAAGLAWTEGGGDVLYVEAALLPGGSGLTLTGHLGEVMQESARAAQSYLWSHAAELGIDPSTLKENGVHVHVPAGAIPKDGPSAGITMATALASLYCSERARADTAMTGEITITGLVLPIGGVKEKVLAARRGDFRRVILPRQNQAHLQELPDEVRKGMEFVLVERVEEVLAAAIPALADRFKVPAAQEA
jgi:ATP-dependent Lon protease